MLSVPRLTQILCIPVCILMLLAPPGLARAGEVPVSAYARSLGVPGLLLDHPGLVFEMPQTAPCYPAQILALAQLRSGPQCIGGILRLGGSRLCFFSQPTASRNATSDSDLLFPTGSTPANVQVGWATDRLPLRVGLATRGFMSQGSSRTVSRYLEEYGSNSDAIGEDREHVVEGALGLGLGKGNRLLDGLVELRWHNIDADAAAGNQRYSQAQGDTSFAFLHQEKKPTASFLLRTQIPLGQQARLIGVGQWGGRRLEWSGYLISLSADSFIDSTSEMEEYQDSWLAGLALSSRLAALDRCIISACYASSRASRFDLYEGSLQLRRIRLSQRAAVLTLALEQGVTQRLAVQAGLRATYAFTLEEDLRFRPTSFLGIQTSRSERMSNLFSWGATYAWKNFRLAGCLRTDLELMTPFLALDLRYLL